MFGIFFNDKNYMSKIKSVTYLRILSFFLWKFIIGLIIYYLFTKFSQNYYISTYVFNKLTFHFDLYHYLELFFLFNMIDFQKIVVFQNYEEHVNNSELAVKIILEPRHQTIFLFFNSFLVAILLKLLEKNASSLSVELKRKRIKLPEYELHMVVYG
jgi:hypothetical protein